LAQFTGKNAEFASNLAFPILKCLHTLGIYPHTMLKQGRRDSWAKDHHFSSSKSHAYVGGVMYEIKLEGVYKIYVYEHIKYTYYKYLLANSTTKTDQKLVGKIMM
jgi:hypothetical protein